ncbi:MAG: hypothetical protein HY293_20045 [Planctomycetes bacterium]|nr:hypothetical protein [Planctomycetota bacterium]
MSVESDAGLDKQNILAAINGAPPAPPPVDRPPSTARFRPILLPPPPGWLRHRSELAAVVSGFVGILWLSVGLARGAWVPSVIGIVFGVGALAIWALEVWNGD